jgi:hypothetical protein
MSTIRSGNTETTGLVYQSDVTGNLVFETLGTTAVTISTAQNVTMANTLAVSGNISSSSTGFMQMPVGNTAQRPASPATGMFRMNSTTGEPEWYDAASTQWLAFSVGANYSIEILAVAGGASGAGSTSGGGGAGGLLYYGVETPKTPNGNSIQVAVGSINSIVIGGGGSAVAQQTIGNNGSNTVVTLGTGVTLTAIGGGRGAGSSSSTTLTGSSGGSGGGGGGYAAGGGIPNSGLGYAGTVGQGNAGGNYSSDTHPGGGGGGSGAVGSNASGGAGGAGGAGLAYSISGSSLFYAAGGGGGSSSAGGAGGSSIGGNGATGTGATNAVVNRGSGGGGGYNYAGGAGGAGSSGVVIIRYLGAPRGTGGTITTSDGYTIHTFTTSGTYTA